MSNDFVLSPSDKINLMKMGIGQGLLDKETEAKLIASEPSLDRELADGKAASSIFFKFVVYKTPIVLDESIRIPEKMIIKFKFFTYDDETSCIIIPK